MTKASIISGLVSAIAICCAGATHAQAANPVTLRPVKIEVKRMELIPSAPLRGAVISRVHSDNETIAKAYPYRNAQVQVVAVGPGRTQVDFWDSTSRTTYQLPVWVVDSGGLASQGYDRTKRQLQQIIMPPGHNQPITVPGAGDHQISSVVSSNRGVATARTNTSNTIMIYSVGLGDSFVDFTDNATGTTYQIHVWVRNGASPINGGGTGGGGTGGGTRRGGGIKFLPPGPLSGMDACLVGNWRSEPERWNDHHMIEGGDGILLTIKPDGRLTVDYDGMRPLKGRVGEINAIRGAATGRIAASGGIARVLKTDTSTLVHTLIDPNGKRSSNSIGLSVGYGVPGTNPPTFAYSCGATSLSYSDFVRTFTFRRVKP
jgi:hypothetical protein